MSVNEKIKLVREAKGFTQEQVAEKLQMSKNGYGDIERGATDPKLSKLEKIAEAFKCELRAKKPEQSSKNKMRQRVCRKHEP
jgi:transcriptional regulator with XRE-family HTH domain